MKHHDSTTPLVWVAAVGGVEWGAEGHEVLEGHLDRQIPQTVAHSGVWHSYLYDIPGWGWGRVGLVELSVASLSHK